MIGGTITSSNWGIKETAQMNASVCGCVCVCVCVSSGLLLNHSHPYKFSVETNDTVRYQKAFLSPN
jgi:hypothetical protein